MLPALRYVKRGSAEVETLRRKTSGSHQPAEGTVLVLLMTLSIATLVLASASLAAAANTPTWSSALIDQPNPAQPGVQLNDVSCPTTTLCVAVDGQGNVVSSINPSGGPAAWQSAHVDSRAGLVAISCAPSKLCVALDRMGNIVTSSNPTGGAGAWTLSGDGAFHVGAIACPASTLCVAVGGSTVMESTSPALGASSWRSIRLVGKHNLRVVSCPTTRFCAIGDDAGNVVTSRDPTGDARSWNTTRLPTYSVRIPQVGRVRVRPSNLWGISCPSADFCAAVDHDAGAVISSSHPTGPTKDWKLIRLASDLGGVAYSRAIACPARQACLALGSSDQGDALISLDPGAGRRAWVASPITTPQFSALTGLTCASTKLCVAVNDKGTAYVATAPTETAAQAARPHVSGSLAGVSERYPRLTLTLTIGIPPGRAIKTIAISSPRGVAFARRLGVRTSLRVTGSRSESLRFTLTSRRGSLMVLLAHSSASVRIILSASALRVSSGLIRGVRQGKVKRLNWRVTLVDAGHRSTTLASRVKVS